MGQAEGAGRPKLLVKTFKSYNNLDEPTEIVESPGGGTQDLRTTTMTYDESGKPITQKTKDGGEAVPKVETVYHPTLGFPEEQRFVCEKAECGPGFDSQATKTKYDSLGRPVQYEDADGNVTKIAYDAVGRVESVSDAKGSQTQVYDPISGLVTKLTDSAAGVFTAKYDADGKMIERGLPNGISATTGYNQAGEPISLKYSKTTFCGSSCTWLQETLQHSINGQIATDNGTLVNTAYSYDKAGRLLEARETPAGGLCKTRTYKYDLDSNRLSMVARASAIGGVCPTSGGTEQKYSYDAADRLEGPTYDPWGRIKSLPAEFAGGKALSTTYFSNEMVASQTQGGITNSFQLDADGRQRARLQGGGGLEGTEILHYDGALDSVSWSERGSTWTRSIGGIGGDLAAIQESGSGTTFQLTNLHGDVVATAEQSPTATKLKATFRFDEFGNPVAGAAGRYGWLGGKSRRTELPSGVIQMGVRSYAPALGRFLSPDPIQGGSPNAYDYAGQDPVNGFDLMGERCHDIKGHRLCHGKQERRELHRAIKRGRREAASLEIKQFHTICVGKAGCYSAQVGGGSGLDLSSLASKLVKAATHRLTHPVSSYGIIGDALMNAVKPVIDEALGGEKGRLRACASETIHGAEEFGGIVAAAGEGNARARLGLGIYAAGKCAENLLGRSP